MISPAELPARLQAYAQIYTSLGVRETPAVLNEAAARIEELEAENAALLRQAEQWKMEAMAHKSSLHEVYQLLTGATGEPGNWNGARPMKQFLQADRNVLTAGLRNWIKRRFGKWITHATAAEFYRSFDVERRAAARAALTPEHPNDQH